MSPRSRTPATPTYCRAHSPPGVGAAISTRRREHAITHDYPTRQVRGDQLDATMTLVGESGGLSSVHETKPSNLAPGLLVVTTEHGPLYLDPDNCYPVLATDEQVGDGTPQDRVYLLVHNTDVAGTGLLVAFRDQQHYDRWLGDVDGAASQPNRPFGFRSEWATTTQVLSAQEAWALIEQAHEPSPSLPARKEPHGD